MKKYNIRVLSVSLVLLIAALLFCTPAFAYYSPYDQQNFPEGSQAYNDLQQATNDWVTAYNAGDQSGMDAAHQAAEDVRATQNYSGGQDGSQYISLGGGDNGNSGGYYYPPAPTTYTITATAGTGGSISPIGSTSVTSGYSQTYTITANSGYMISDVKVDGSSVGVSSTYTFSSVTEAHSISATFTSAATLSAGSVTLGDGGSGTLKSGNTTKSGYGITTSLPVTTSYVSGTKVTASYNFTSPQTVSLENVNGTWQFPVNPSSSTGARKIYIPVNTPGTAVNPKSYTITFTVTALDPQATALTGSNVYLTSTKTVMLTIDGSMYEDDFTGNS